MTSKFDVQMHREDMMTVQLPIMSRFDPGKFAPAAVSGQLAFNVSSLTKCYWLGLAQTAAPLLLDILRWMETRVPPDLANWHRDPFHPLEGAMAHRDWWLASGMGKWLVGMPGGEADLARAAEATWNGWQQVSPNDAKELRGERQSMLSRDMAMALAANRPETALLFYDSAGVRRPSSLVRPAFDFGRWACRHLIEGGARDAAFVARGARMLEATLLPYFRPSAKWIEPTLWLKAIYFDSGVTRTAEETIFRVYDSLPGIPRPDFVPR